MHALQEELDDERSAVEYLWTRAELRLLHCEHASRLAEACSQSMDDDRRQRAGGSGLRTKRGHNSRGVRCTREHRGGDWLSLSGDDKPDGEAGARYQVPSLTSDSGMGRVGSRAGQWPGAIRRKTRRILSSLPGVEGGRSRGTAFPDAS